MSSYWQNLSENYCSYNDLGISLDTSLSAVDINAKIAESSADIERVWQEMTALEAGEIVNVDEQRKVGHYWLRDSSLAATNEREEIDSTLQAVEQFVDAVQRGTIVGSGGIFTHLLVIGIGGSALGSQLLYDCATGKHKLVTLFMDNTDPEGIDTILSSLKDNLATTLVIVVSKSGGTPETRNGLLETAHYFQQQGIAFGQQAVAITGKESVLYQYAQKQHFLDIFIMQDWIGGRTSITSVVGLLAAALQGINIRKFLAGAKAMDQLTRQPIAQQNMALRMALTWQVLRGEKGEKSMVVLPYKDRLGLLSKYLQQLIMESLGKEKDLKGNTVHQGLTVFGNKGSTDQHAYIQQLRDGVANFFALFIEVRKGRQQSSIAVDQEGNNSNDYLYGFLHGTRTALSQASRHSLLLTIDELNDFTLGAILALFERSVSFYASLVEINAYHQPGVEAGKKAAEEFLQLLNEIRGVMTNYNKTADDIAQALGKDAYQVYSALRYLAVNNEISYSAGESVTEDTFQL